MKNKYKVIRKLDKQHRITIPQYMIDDLKLQSNSELELTFDSGKLIVEPYLPPNEKYAKLQILVSRIYNDFNIPTYYVEDSVIKVKAIDGNTWITDQYVDINTYNKLLSINSLTNFPVININSKYVKYCINIVDIHNNTSRCIVLVHSDLCKKLSIDALNQINCMVQLYNSLNFN